MEPSYSMWAYSHQYDPGYIQWHNDMMQQAASNAQLSAQMAQLNAQMAQMNSQHLAPQPNVVPQGVDPNEITQPAQEETPVQQPVTQAPAQVQAPAPVAAPPSPPVEHKSESHPLLWVGSAVGALAIIAVVAIFIL